MRYLLQHKSDYDYNVVTVDSTGTVYLSTGTWWDTPERAISQPQLPTMTRWKTLSDCNVTIVGNDQDNPELFI